MSSVKWIAFVILISARAWRLWKQCRTWRTKIFTATRRTRTTGPVSASLQGRRRSPRMSLRSRRRDVQHDEQGPLQLPVQCLPADGAQKSVSVANRQLPGPSIEDCRNDRIVVNARNAMI